MKKPVVKKPKKKAPRRSTARPVKGAQATRARPTSETSGGGRAAAAPVRRFGQLIGLRTERLDEYRRIHAAVWPEILRAIREAGIRNYSIFHWGGKLFAYFEYHGPAAEYEERMREIARAPRMREWWDVTDPMQRPLEGREPGSWWAGMEEVFHTD